MGMCATKKPVRRYANGGMLDNPLEAVMPFEPRQPAANPLQNQVNALDQKIAMGNAMDGLSNTERYQLANPTNSAYKPGSMMGGTSADASMQRQQTSILQNLRSGIAAQMPDTQQSKWVGGGTESSIPSIGDAFQIGQPRRFADGGIVGLLKNRKKAIDDAVNGAESPNAIVQANPPSAGVKPSMGSQADNYAAEAAKLEAEQLAAARAAAAPKPKQGLMSRLGFAQGGVVQPNMYLGEQIRASRPPNLLNAAGEAVDSLPYAAAQFVPGLNVPLGAAAASVHAAQGRFDELPLDAVSMVPGGKGVYLAKGAKLAATKAIGQAGRTANTVQALGAADAFGSPAYANGGVVPKGKNQQIADGLAQRARFEGKGGPREDQIPVKVAGQNIKVSDGEEAMIIPAKTAANPEAMKAIMEIIRQTNDGREPGAQLKEGGKYAEGLVDYSIPADQRKEAAIAQANKAPYVAPVQKPLNVKANFETPDISMLAADPRGYESARKTLAPEAPTAKQAPVVARSLAASVEPVAQGLQERTFGAQAPRSLSDIVQPTASPVAPNAMAGSMTMNGKTVEIQKGGGYTDTAGNPTDDWTKTDRYAQAMQVNERMSNLARQMERDRYGRDMQADITNPKVIALAKLNLDRMNQEDETQQQGIASGLDSRIKQNALAQSDQERKMIDRMNDPSLTPEQRISMRSDLLAMKGKNPNEHRYITRPNTKVYNDMGQIIGEEPGDIFDTAIGGPISGGSGRSQKMPAPKSKAEMDALPKGTRYTAPDGSVRVKP